MSSISIVMPCYNEEDIIESVVRSYYNEIVSNISDSEFIVVDDNSTDSSYSILNRLKKEFPKLKIFKTPFHSGHGIAILLGYKLASKDFVFQVDSDNQFEPKDFWKLYSLKDNYTFIIGFRKKRNDPVYRIFLSRLTRIIIFFLFGVWINDANCPFRLIRRDILSSVIKILPENALIPNIMISIFFVKKKMEIAEVPIRHYPRKTGKVSINNLKLISFSLRCFFQLVRFKKMFSKNCKFNYAI